MSIKATQESRATPIAGKAAIGFVIVAFALVIAGSVVAEAMERHSGWAIAATIAVIGAGATGMFTLLGFFMLEPNEAKTLLLFGAYRGTVRGAGFYWANPFYARKGKVSLRARTFVSEQLKVNDKRGNPIEIAAIVVWHIADTAKAMFDVDNVEAYVRIQSETALRHLATLYAYDRHDDDEASLRDSGDVLATQLQKELQTKLALAGVIVDDARLSHLAYAPEIAHVMLRRQQAEAVIAARQKIVSGAVGMVDQALRELADKHVVQLDDERKAAMVSNLLVVLCSESEARPVINAGTLY